MYNGTESKVRIAASIINQAQAACNLPALTLVGSRGTIEEAKLITERMKNIDVALVFELWNEYAATVNDGDLERWISLWIDDAVQMPPGAPRRVGKEQIRRGVQPLFDLFGSINMSIHAEEIRILGDWAYSHGTYEFEMTPKEGGATKSYSGKFLDILEKQVDGSWKIAIDCHNSNAPSEWVWC